MEGKEGREKGRDDRRLSYHLLILSSSFGSRKSLWNECMDAIFEKMSGSTSAVI